jgi:hypothetical protein
MDNTTHGHHELDAHIIPRGDFPEKRHIEEITVKCSQPPQTDYQK